MSRRDTIIVAVLVNAGLLIVLFASALKSGSFGDEFVAQPKTRVEQIAPMKIKSLSPATIGDEVDVALSQYTPPQPASALTKSEPVAVVESAPVVQPFAEELKFVSPPEVKPAPVVAVAPRAVEKTTADPIEHRVKKGDVLEKIARHHQCSVDQIMKFNGLTSTNLRIGQVLKIPVSGSVAPASLPSQDAPKYYVVKNGDNPWTIAVKNHMKVDELLKLNDLNEEKARRLKPGDQLRIR